MKNIFALLASSSVAALAVSSPAIAQPAAPSVQENAADEGEEIVVTGSNIRGVAPSGSNVIGLTEQDIADTGGGTTQEVLAQLPQAIGMFNNVLVAGGNAVSGLARTQIVRPNLRNLPGGATATGAQTLLLIDGHRVVGTGIGILAVDPEALPPGALARVEVITDGGSSVYGSDAIGGVMNFITRRNFEGLEVGGHYGVADHYNQYDVDVTAGTTWQGGSIMGSYAYAYHDDLQGRNIDAVNAINNATGIPSSRTCAESTITRSGFPAGTVFAGTAPTVPIAASAPPPVTCDATDYQSFVPEATHHNFFAALEQDLTSSLQLDVRGYYQTREDINSFGGMPTFLGTPAGGATALTIPSTNYYRNQLGFSAAETQTAAFDYSSVLGNESAQGTVETESWQITPTLTWDVGGEWQIRAMANYGRSETRYATNQPNTTLQTAALAGSTADTAINPYDISATQNLALIRAIGSFVDRGEGKNELTNYRVIADGPLLTLPGGDVQMAVGVEYTENDYRHRFTNATTRTFNPYGAYTQEVSAQFGEISIPIVSADNNIPLISSLTLSASVRRDDYSDVGESTNPQIGLTYEPVDWIAIRGTWGTQFNAPTPPDGVGIQNGPRIRVIPGSFLLPTVVTNGVGPTALGIVADQGTDDDLEPQEAEAWSAGFTISPPFLEGLQFSATYYHIMLTNFMNSPATATGANGLFANFPFALQLNLGGASNAFCIANPGVCVANEIPASQVAAFLSQFPASSLPAIPPGAQIVGITDSRVTNLGSIELSGVDFMVSYTVDTSFGSLDFALSGNHQIQLDQKLGLSPVSDNLQYGGPGGTDGPPALHAQFMVGATIGDFRAQATVNHTGGYDLRPGQPSIVNQTEVEPFTTVNTLFRYDFDDEGVGQGLSLTLNINNLLDEEPSVVHSTTGTSIANGFTVGRLVTLGFNQRF